MRIHPWTTLAVAGLLASCADSGIPDGSARRLSTEREQIGDTVVVRTVGADSPAADLDLVEELVVGREDGAPEELLTGVQSALPTPDGGVIFYETGARRFRQFDSAGRFVRNFGGYGEGPGEYRSPNGARLGPDGRVVIWDRRNRTVSVFNSAGELEKTWRVPAEQGELGLMGVGVSPDGHVFTRIIDPDVSYNPSACGDGFTDWRVLRTTLDGSIADTLLQPRISDSRRLLYNSGPLGPDGRLIMAFPTERQIPLAAEFHTTFSPLGYWISGDALRYAVTLHRAEGGPLRIESDLRSTRAAESERRAHFYRLESAVRRTDEQVSLSLSLIPEVKAYFNQICTGHDGRIWVRIHREASPIPLDSAALANQRAAAIVTTTPPDANWVEPTVYDVFEPSGEFVGRVTIPDGSVFLAAIGDIVWLMRRDSEGIPRLIRHRIRKRQGG